MKRQKSELTKIISIICSIVIILVATIPAAVLIGGAVSDSSTIVFEAGEAYVAPISGTPGTKAELPANVAIVGKTFEGWYTDAGFTKPAGDNYKFPKADTVDTLYAKMVIENGTLVTFDDMPNELITNPGGKFHTSGCYSIAKNTGINGTAALKRDSYTSNEDQEKYTALNSGNDFLKLSANSVYKFSFNYYVEKTDTTSLYPCLLTSGDNHWNGYKRWLCTSLDGTRSDNNGVPGNAIDISETGVWKKVDFFVSTKNIDSGMNYAYIGFQGANKAVFYVDNIEVVRVAENKADTAVVFADYDFNGFSKTYVGTAGGVLTVEKPMRDGYEFAGWQDYNSGAVAAEPTAYTTGITMLKALWTEKTGVTVTFDDMPSDLMKNTGSVYHTSGCFTLESGKGINNSTALKYSLPKNDANSDQIKPTVLNEGTEMLKAKSNTAYYVSLRYKVEAATSNKIKLSVVTAGDSHWDSRVQLPNGGTEVDTTAANSEWKYVGFTFTTGSFNGKDNLFFATQYGNDGTVYFDDINVRKLFSLDENKGAVLANPLDGSETKVYVGTVGSAVNVENPAPRSGLSFSGWFSDENCTSAVAAPTAFEAGIHTLFAGWKNSNTKVITFDDMPADLMKNNGNIYHTSGCYSLVSGKGINGSIALKREIADDNGLKPTVLNDSDNFLNLESNTVYSVKFNYLVEKAAPLKTSIVTGNDSHWIGRREWPSGGITVDVSALNTWKTMEYVIETGELDVSTNAFFAMTGSKSTVYIDNIEITKLFEGTENKGALFVDYGNGKIDKIIGNVGDAVNVIVPDRSSEGMTFIGWFKDSQNAEKIDAPTSLAKGVTYIYAGWKAENSTVVTFDDMPADLMKNFGSTYHTSGCYSLAPGKGINGSVALKRQITGDEALKPTALNRGNNLLTFDSNTAYKIKFSYFIEKAGSELKTSIVTGGESHWSGRQEWPKGGTAVNLGTVGSWQTMEYIVMTGNLGSNNKAFFAMQGANSTVYIDNVEVSMLFNKSEKKGAAYIDYGNGEHTIIIGEAGASINISMPQMGEEYRFVGWYSDGDYSKKIAVPTTIEESKVIYAFAQWVNYRHIVTFDDMPDDLMISDSKKNIFTSSTCYSIGTGVGINGTKALVRVNPKSSDMKPTSLNDGKDFYRLKNNSRYKITIHYYLPEKSTAPKFGLLVGGSTSSWNGREVISSNISGVGTPGVWHEVSFIAKTGKLSQRCAYLTVAGTTSKMYIDNVEISLLDDDDVVLEYKVPALSETSYVVGKAGQPITGAPTPAATRNWTFGGWFADDALTVPFNASVFPSEDMTVYGNMIRSKVMTTGFDNYPFPTEFGSIAFGASVMDIMQGRSSDGDGYCVRLDNRKERQSIEIKKVVLNLDSGSMELENKKRYLIAYDLFVDTPAAGSVKVNFFTSGKENMWDSGKEMTKQISYNISGCAQRQWFTGYAAGEVDAKKGKTTLNFAISAPLESVICFDNIRVQEIPDGYNALILSNGYGNSPKPYIVKNGTKVTLPTSISGIPAGKLILGWMTDDYVDCDKTYTVANDTVLLAKVTLSHAFEDFENAVYPRGLVQMGYDYDWAIYNAADSGHSKDDVVSGTHSLHRVGDEYGFKAYCLQRNNSFSANQTSPGVMFTVKMNVKVENPVHKLGAIELVNSVSLQNPWDISGEKMPIAAIADIADGKWHEISYTFKASSELLTVITPGNLSIYIDDITLGYAGKDAVASADVAFEEYIPMKLNKDGTYGDGNKYSVGEFKLHKRETAAEIDASLWESYTGWFIAAIVLGSAVVVGAVFVTLGITKKKKGGK